MCQQQANEFEIGELNKNTLESILYNKQVYVIIIVLYMCDMYLQFFKPFSKGFIDIVFVVSIQERR